jgi:hypothetical protein
VSEDGIRTRDPNLGKVAVSAGRAPSSLLGCGFVHPVSTTSSQFVAVVERSTTSRFDQLTARPAHVSGYGAGRYSRAVLQSIHMENMLPKSSAG